MYNKKRGEGLKRKAFSTGKFLIECELLPSCVCRIGIATARVAECGDAFGKCGGIRLKFALEYLFAVDKYGHCALGIEEALVKEEAEFAVSGGCVMLLLTQGNAHASVADGNLIRHVLGGDVDFILTGFVSVECAVAGTVCHLFYDLKVVEGIALPSVHLKVLPAERLRRCVARELR